MDLLFLFLPILIILGKAYYEVFKMLFKWIAGFFKDDKN